jgi:aminopeptidase N
MIMKTDVPRPIRLENYRPPEFLIDTVELNFTLDPTRTRVMSRLQMRPNPDAAKKGQPLSLDGETLELGEVKLDGKKLEPGEYQVTDRHLILPRVPQKPFTLEIETFVNPEANKALQGLYRSRGIYCTQCEPEGFRRITYFVDRPDVLAIYTTRIEADAEEAPVLLSNGNPVERGTIDGGKRHYAVWKDPFPKPSYLFALVGGNLSAVTSTFRTKSGRKVDLAIYVEPGKENRCGWAMDSLKRAMRWDEERFGLEYDLDVFNIVAVSDFNMGAMENKGLNIFNDRLILVSPETATDALYEAVESVVAHEYFHNWTGNRITCRDWFQLCLKEGLTVYRDQEFSADERSRTVQRISDVRQLKAHQFPEDAGPLAHPVRPDSYIEINNFYTATVYEKGAEVIRMIEQIVGREGFRAGMDLYIQRHDGQAATVEQFVKCFEDANGVDLSQFMLWYKQAGTPELICSLDYNEARKEAKLTVEQVLKPTPGQPNKKPMHIPLRLGLLGGNGEDIDLNLADSGPVPDGVIHVKKRKQTFRFTHVPSKPVPSLLRGFSAPVKLNIDLSDRDLAFLMANDSDLFNRWQAANTYAMRMLIQLVKARTEERRPAQAVAYAQALGASLRNEDLEPAYRAELLKLPSENDIAREIAKNVDPDAIHRARKRLLRIIGETLGAELEDIYKSFDDGGKFSPDAASAGRRALRNAALTLLSARNTAADKVRLADHYWKASNMTEAAHALYLLAARGGTDAKKALDDFYQRWKGDHLVIDTWFAAQAISPLAGTLARVKALTRHPLFSLTTPNKVRALIGNFAAQNLVQFNRPDGAGYEFVVEQVLAIDKFNPQIAARMLSGFRSWRELEPGRRKLARKALRQVAKVKGLSRDVTEIVTKMLEAPPAD